jgi:hypothetical protein
MMPIISGMKENPVFDPSGVILWGISGNAEMFDSRESFPALFSDTADATGIFPGEAR